MTEQEASMRDALEAERKLALVLTDYVGRWVAVVNHRVVADADDLQALIDNLDFEVESVFKVTEGCPFFGALAALPCPEGEAETTDALPDGGQT